MAAAGTAVRTQPLAGGQTYRDTTFRGVAQTRHVPGSVFAGCTFEDARLREVHFLGCRFLACTFIDCDLSLARVERSVFRDVSFDASNLTGVNFALASSTLHDPLEVDFRDCVMDFAVFRGCQLDRRRLDHCRCHEVDLRDATLRDGVCRGSDFAGADFTGADLSRADFRKARNYAIDVRSTTVKGARFTLPDAAALLQGLEVQVEQGAPPRPST